MVPPAPVPPPSPRVLALRSTIRDLVALVGSEPAERLRRRPAPREWSPAIVLAHLADAELVYAVRLRMLLTAPEPTLQAFDEEAWSDRFGELDADPRSSLDRWKALRSSTLAVLEGIAPNEWDRAGVHEERGRLTVADIADLLAAHDRAHLDQIRRALA